MKKKKRITKPALSKLSVIEILIMLGLVATVSVYWPNHTRALLIGLLVFFIPSQLFAWISFIQVGAVKRLEVVKNFYLAEIIKYVATIGLFAYGFYLASDTIEANIILFTYLAFWLVHQALLGVLFKKKTLG